MNCRECGINKVIDNFYPSSIERHDYICKKCHKQHAKEYYQKNKEYHKQYYLKHKIEINKYNKRWQKQNKEYLVEYLKDYQIKYQKTEKGKQARRKINAKRKRNLGYNSINKPFKDCEGHHLNKIDVIYIPKKLHRSTYHNVFTGKGMNEINDKAFSWLEGIKNL